MSSLKEVVEVSGVGSRHNWEGGVDALPGSFDSTQRGRNTRLPTEIFKGAAIYLKGVATLCLAHRRVIRLSLLSLDYLQVHS